MAQSRPPRPASQSSASVGGFCSRQDDKHGPACYLSAMEWIICIIIAVVVVCALAGVVALTAKRREGGTVRGWFEFDKYKTGENSKRSLHDKTRWR